MDAYHECAQTLRGAMRLLSHCLVRRECAAAAQGIGLWATLLMTASSVAAVPPNREEALPQAAAQVPGGGSHGARIFETICATCHKGQVQRAPTRSSLELMPPAAIVRALTSGAMRAVGEGLSPQERVDVAEYLTERKVETGDDRPPPVCAREAANFDYREPPVFDGWGLQPTNTRYVDPQVGGLTATNVGRLRLKWAFRYPGAVRARSQPALAAGALFVGSEEGVVYALDRRTGCLRWQFRASSEVRHGIVIARWPAGDRSSQPLAYFGDILGNVYAVRATDGVLAWKSHPDDNPFATMTASPALHDGVLYVPISSFEESKKDDDCCTFRGSIVALDAITGRQVWRTYMVDEPKELGTYPNGRKHFGPSGIALWNTPAIDARRGLLYLGTGDNYSLPATSMSDAVVALELATGKVRWVNQVTAGDVWTMACMDPVTPTCLTPRSPDFDFGAASILATTKQGRDLVVSAQKSGWVYAMDPGNGALVWRTRVGRGGVSAGIYFGISAHDDRVFVPVADQPDGRSYDIAAQPGMNALDLATGKVLWSTVIPDAVCEGRPQGCMASIFAPPTTTAGLVISGASDGFVRIQSALDGATLWQFDTARQFDTVDGGKATGGSIGTGIVAAGGMLIVNSGYSYGQMNGNVMLVFELGDSG